MALMLMLLLPCTGFSQFRVAKFLSFFGAARTQILVITRNQSLLWCSKFMLCNDFLPWIGFTNVRKLPLSNSLTFRVFPTVDDVEGIYIVQMFLKKGSANRRNCFYYIMKHSHEENSNNFDFREPWCFSSLKKRRTLFPAVRVQQHLSGPRDLGVNLFIQLQDGSTSHPFLRKLSEQLWGFSLILECLGSVFCLHACFVAIITHCKCDNML